MTENSYHNQRESFILRMWHCQREASGICGLVLHVGNGTSQSFTNLEELLRYLEKTMCANGKKTAQRGLK